MKIKDSKNPQLKWWSKIIVLSTVLFAILSPNAYADAPTSGNKAYEKGDVRIPTMPPTYSDLIAPTIPS
ncbi:hypothetical protein [Sphingobium sp.]|uniref:hypothetical protein n=1 Tax=Sphingobium sp. TaxID=1912891 RepID=UPI00257E1276|nr:hypothetical protein [Sphingobium sp.]